MRQTGILKRKVVDEIPTVALLIFCYGAYLAITFFANFLGSVPSIICLALVLVLHSSLQHEIIHGHPTSNQRFNDILVSPAIGLYVPYLRFKNTHLAHHFDPNLTDPYDDPESNYLDPAQWSNMPKWRQILANFNNTLFGRMLVGPFLGMMCFYRTDLMAIIRRDRRILFSYIHHGAGLVPVLVWQQFGSTLSVWAYLLAAYFALSILRVRTFLEHKADDLVTGRTVVVEDKGLLALLFLNNNYHAVHHANPRAVWHQLPAIYSERREDYLRRNRGYWFRSYWDVFRLYFFSQKDTVPHPLMEGSEAALLEERDGCSAIPEARIVVEKG